MTIREAFIRHDTEVLCAKNKVLKTRKNYRCALNSFIRACTDIQVEYVTVQHIVQWNAHMAQLGYQSSYAAANVSKMRGVFKHLKRLGFNVLDYELMERPEIIQKDPVWLTIDEVQRFLSVIKSPRDKALFSMMFSSGARISEILQLDRDSVHIIGDLSLGEAHIIGKGNKPGTLSFDSSALEALHDYFAIRNDNLRPLFVSGQYKRLGYASVARLAHRYADIARLDKFNMPNTATHIFRHSFATDLKFNGADIYDIQKQLRHQRISSTEIYVHINDAQKQRIYEKHHTPTPIY